MSRKKLWGRDREIEVLRGCLDRCEPASPNVVVLAGPAGIGKTSLLEVAAGLAVAGGRTVRWARGLPTGGAPPFWLFKQLLGVRSHGPGGDDRFGLFEALYADVARAAPALFLVDDIQWTDESSLLALAYVLRRLAGEDVVFLASLRIDDFSDGWARGRG
jgi:predicted ATPase